MNSLELLLRGAVDSFRSNSCPNYSDFCKQLQSLRSEFLSDVEYYDRLNYVLQSSVNDVFECLKHPNSALNDHLKILLFSHDFGYRALSFQLNAVCWATITANLTEVLDVSTENRRILLRLLRFLKLSNCVTDLESISLLLSNTISKFLLTASSELILFALQVINEFSLEFNCLELFLPKLSILLKSSQVHDRLKSMAVKLLANTGLPVSNQIIKDLYEGESVSSAIIAASLVEYFPKLEFDRSKCPDSLSKLVQLKLGKVRFGGIKGCIWYSTQHIDPVVAEEELHLKNSFSSFLTLKALAKQPFDFDFDIVKYLDGLGDATIIESAMDLVPDLQQRYVLAIDRMVSSSYLIKLASAALAQKDVSIFIDVIKRIQFFKNDFGNEAMLLKACLDSALKEDFISESFDFQCFCFQTLSQHYDSIELASISSLKNQAALLMKFYDAIPEISKADFVSFVHK